MDSTAYEQRLINDMLMRRALHGQGTYRHCVDYSDAGPSGLMRCHRYAPGAGLYEYGGVDRSKFGPNALQKCDLRYVPVILPNKKCNRYKKSGMPKRARKQQPVGLAAYQACIKKIRETVPGMEKLKDAREYYHKNVNNVYNCM